MIGHDAALWRMVYSVVGDHDDDDDAGMLEGTF